MEEDIQGGAQRSSAAARAGPVGSGAHEEESVRGEMGRLTRGAPKVSDEAKYYPIVKDWLQGLLKQRYSFCHLEITHKGQFSGEIKKHILPGREIIFHFLKQAAPDLTGFVTRERGSGWIVVEVKDTAIRFKDVSQIRGYAELFGAGLSLLLSTKEIPEEIRRLHGIAPYIFSTLTGHGAITLGWLREQDGGLTAQWFPDDPLAKGALERILFG